MALRSPLAALPLPARPVLRAFAARHRVLLIALAVAVLLRAVTVLGFRWGIWFPDSYPYVELALNPRPDVVRTFGYPFLLLLLRPLHSFAVVVTVQHLMGLASAVILYGLLRRPHLFRFGKALPGWAATLAVAPLLFDGNQIELEHLLLSDTYFLLLVCGAAALVLWTPRPSARRVAAACLLLSMAAITRTIGLPLLIIVLVFLAIRRVGWRTLVAGAVTAIVPIAAYMTWYASANGQFALSGTDGVFLYSRTMTFADCDNFGDRLPVDAYPLCDSTPPEQRRASHFYVWEESQIFRYPGGIFDPYKSELARTFAKEAILAQPGDYLQTVLTDFGRTFRWDRPVYPDPKTYGYYVFPTESQGYWPGRDAQMARYDAQAEATRVVEPFAGFMRAYQKGVYLPGTVLGVLLLVALGGVAARWRRFGGPALLPFGFAMALLVIPPATVLFDYRYVLPAVPFASVAAAMALRELHTWYRSRHRPDHPPKTPEAGGTAPPDGPDTSESRMPKDGEPEKASLT
ncbi:hypothetical protein EDD29_0180 [Actinocorallia herbida]|uniref:Dolichyl-phosphate-mannose-protein mannosyltransferase n=1 Tax=Actinocorallia herbida TaxID=58109 RepID=A0A3N1CPQ1_9ACTN|nr:hypothetical protein [Actinocorallia herbida]ROO82698.1 hypothetical protein EDD29_0180 [Actinocorallia herbida]